MLLSFVLSRVAWIFESTFPSFRRRDKNHIFLFYTTRYEGVKGGDIQKYPEFPNVRPPGRERFQLIVTVGTTEYFEVRKCEALKLQGDSLDVTQTYEQRNEHGINRQPWKNLRSNLCTAVTSYKRPTRPTTVVVKRPKAEKKDHIRQNCLEIRRPAVIESAVLIIDDTEEETV